MVKGFSNILLGGSLGLLKIPDRPNQENQTALKNARFFAQEE
jgi:hypothetical protein